MSTRIGPCSTFFHPTTPLGRLTGYPHLASPWSSLVRHLTPKPGRVLPSTVPLRWSVRADVGVGYHLTLRTRVGGMFPRHTSFPGFPSRNRWQYNYNFYNCVYSSWNVLFSFLTPSFLSFSKVCINYLFSGFVLRNNYKGMITILSI